MSATVLIADDEPGLLSSLEFLMRREGYNVRTARDGQEALEGIIEHRPDVVLLDVMMPHKTGLEVCAEVRARDDVKDTRIIMLTAMGRDADVAKGLAAGANAYMTKPFSAKELVGRVRELLLGQD
jgi:DNA-binding response OmpR family regulator